MTIAVLVNKEEMPPRGEGTIKSHENTNDNVSTLSNTYFGEGAADLGTLAEPRTDDMVDVSMISSEQRMYIFGVGRQRRRPAVQLKRRS